MSNKTARPFEVGDLVTGHTIYRPVIKTIATITKFFNGEIAVKMDDSDFILQNNEFIVNYIRKPRKGSKEARDIVAMLARKYKSLLHDYLEYWHDQNASDDDIKKYWNHRRDGGQFRNHERYLTFQTAKSMLK